MLSIRFDFLCGLSSQLIKLPTSAVLYTRKINNSRNCPSCPSMEWRKCHSYFAEYPDPKHIWDHYDISFSKQDFKEQIHHLWTTMNYSSLNNQSMVPMHIYTLQSFFGMYGKIGIYSKLYQNKSISRIHITLHNISFQAIAYYHLSYSPPKKKKKNPHIWQILKLNFDGSYEYILLMAEQEE